MKVAIFGASGFVGRAVATSLQSRGFEVGGIQTPRLGSSARDFDSLGRELSHSVDELLPLADQLRGYDAVVNAAGVSDATDGWTDELAGANSLLPATLAQMTAKAGVPVFIHISSAAVLGNRTLDASRVWCPSSPYAESKALGEQLLLANLPTSTRTTIYRPPGVHDSSREVTRKLAKLSRSIASSVAGDGQRPSPQTLSPNVADAVRFLLESDSTPLIVSHPWEGQTTQGVLANLSGGRRPTPIPRVIALLVLRAARRTRLNPAHIRRLEVLWFGQNISPSWFDEAGWKPPIGEEGWKALGDQLRHPQKSQARPRIVFAVTASLQVPYLGRTPEYFADHGWDVHLVSSPGPEVSDARARTPALTVHETAMVRDPSPIADLKALLNWVSLLRRIRPDVLMLGTPKASLLGLTSGALLRVPVRSYLLRGLRLETATGLLRGVLWILERGSMLASTEVISTSPSLATRSKELGLVGGKRIVVLGSGSSHGIDLSRFNIDVVGPDSRRSTRDSLDLDESDFLVGFVGRIRTDKGVPELIQAIEQMNHHDPVKLLLVGRVEEASVIDLAAAGIAAGQIIHLDHVEDIERVIAAFDVLCLPSHREGFPNVVIEAAALQVPSATSNATGVIDAVIDNETGKLFDTGDTKSLVAALESMRDPCVRRRFAKNAYTRVVEEFDDRQVNARFLDHMNSQVSEPRKQASR